MAINKKLIHFNKKSDFESEVANGNILSYSICFIADTKEIYTHGNYYSQVSEAPTDGLKYIRVNGAWYVLSTSSSSADGLMSASDKAKLDGIESGAQKNTVVGVKGNSESSYRTGSVNITKANIGLGNVDNTSDTDKPISTAQQTALDKKVDKITGKGLSTNDYTTDEKNKLAGIAVGALVNIIESVKVNGSVQTISNKEVDITIPTKLSLLTNNIYKTATSAEITAILN